MIKVKPVLLSLALCAVGATAQNAGSTKHEDFSKPFRKVDYSLVPKLHRIKSRSASAVRPDHVHNGLTPYFAPTFNQDNGSCGSAAYIAYQMAHELNAYRGTYGNVEHNMLPTHFTWLLTYGNSDKADMAKAIGVPPVDVYGGRTYSRQLGSYDWDSPDAGWMQGYDKWYSAMWNRVSDNVSLPYSLAAEDGRELLKNWLWNHFGDESFKAGGVAGIGVASGGVWADIPSTPANNDAGVTGMKYVKQWGTSVDHALTIVGYDDRIEFDLNGNGVYGEKEADEVGAWIIANSWGNGWCNGGFIYCPYAYGGAVFTADGKFNTGSWWTPGLIYIRKDYVPQRTIRIRMDHSRRSEMYLSAGVSADLNATEPEFGCAFEHFKYAGDGHNGDSIPAPEVPMLGRWADGKLHDEPMEFGYDLTDITNQLDPNLPLKYFFTVTTRDGALGEGHIYDASIIDYVISPDGMSTPFDITAPGGVKIEKGGGKTYITVVVNGRGSYPPRNVSVGDGTLCWDEPMRSGQALTGYRIYSGDKLLGETDAAARSFELPDADVRTYAVSALYGTQESKQVMVEVPGGSTLRSIIDLTKNGLTLPDVFGAHYDQATIEFWINCNSLLNWNQSAGPGWGTFMFHANSDGRFTAGWDTQNRIDAAGALKVGTWSHIALVVDGNHIVTYVDGVKKNELTSSKYSGLGGFGDLVFAYSAGSNSHTDAKLKELRIWKTARTAAEIKNFQIREFSAAGIPADLIAYYKGDLIEDNGVMKLRDHARYHRHGVFANDSYQTGTSNKPTFRASTDLSVKIQQPSDELVAGVPAGFEAVTGSGVRSLAWTVAGAGVDSLSSLAPSVVFPSAGTYSVIAKAIGSNATVSDTLEVTVQAAPAPDAAFSPSSAQIPAGESVSFRVASPRMGYTYHWQMPGAGIEEANTTDAAATYSTQGDYEVTLTVTAPDGRTARATQIVKVCATAPVADFAVSPALVVKGETVVLSDRSKYEPTEWNWTLFNGSAAATGNERYCSFVPAQPGKYDLTLTVRNSAGENTVRESEALIVCNADSKNGLFFTGDANRVTASSSPMTNNMRYFTIDWWMRPSSLGGDCQGVGDKASTLKLNTAASGAMRLTIKNKTISSPDGFVVAGEWHHYAVTFAAGRTVCFYRDGVLVSTAQFASIALVPGLERFAIGLDEAPMRGQIDEFRVWNKTLDEAAIRSYCNQPIEDDALAAAEAAGLVLYYGFNQSGGNVTDATSKGNTGIRSGFGPDGDAWGLSRGVFSLNFEAGGADVTSDYLVNYKAPFATTGTVYNPSGGRRFMEISDWTRENEGNTAQPTGGHVDTARNNYLAFSTGWDGFGGSITNHKFFQSVTLPEGFYVLEANFGTHEGHAEGSYVVAAEGVGLPGTDALTSSALGYAAIHEKSISNMSTSAAFQVDKEKTVSLGLLMNMSGYTWAGFESFVLRRYSATPMEAAPTGITDIPMARPSSRGIYDLRGVRRDRMDGKGIYIRDGRKVYNP